MSTHHGWAAAGLWVVAAAGCGGGGDAAGTGGAAAATAAAPAKTPGEVFARANAAAKSDRFADILPCFQPDGQGLIVYRTLVVAEAATGMSKDAAAQAVVKQALDAIKQARAVKPLKDTPAPAVGDAPALRAAAVVGLAGVDQAGLFGDLVGFLEKHGGKDASFKNVFVGELKDLTEKGNEAEGKVNGEPFHFVKLGEAWYLAVK